MKKDNYDKGKIGEQEAMCFLKQEGFELIEFNYANKYGQIDLIMTENGVLVFVEVKAAFGRGYGRPEERIGRGKLWQMKRAAESYLMLNTLMRERYGKYRLDAVCLNIGDGGKVERIKHYRNLDGL